MAAAQFTTPYSQAQLVTIRIEISVEGLPEGASVDVADLMLQPGRTATLWAPNPTEMPWAQGVVGG